MPPDRRHKDPDRAPEVRDRRLLVKLSAAEDEQIAMAAIRAGLSKSAWVRRACAELAGREQEPPRKE